MAGRGVDIKLGGVPLNGENMKTVERAGGLFVLGTERHESRRIDNQLRGRSARQGDPGETQFFVSTDDDLMRIFAGERMKGVMERLNVPDDMPIEQKMITKMLEGAQKKVEGHNFDIRKHLLEYDDVLNRHREVIYKKRRQILGLSKQDSGLEEKEEEGSESDLDKKYSSLKEMILDLVDQEVEFIVSFHTNVEDRKDWNMKEVYETMKTVFPFNQEEREQLLHMGGNGDSKLEDVEARDQTVKFLMKKAEQEYESITDQIVGISSSEEEGGTMMQGIEKNILLRSIDNLWVEHLVAIDYLRTGIGLRGYGQRDPLVEYKKETYSMFNELLSGIQKEVVYSFYKVGAGLQLAPTVMANDKLVMKGAQKSANDTPGVVQSKLRDDSGKKVGRNDPCPCGSGKKHKKCCGK